MLTEKKSPRVPKHVWILLLIIAVGIFVRTYHFHEWLQFSPDEVRDATIVSNAIEGKAPLPLLGPIAGGTNFHLGPIFYYFEYAAARIFGDSPDKMAYFDLLTSVLAIPLLFLFLKKYFKTEISLSLAALMSVSYFFVYISRFASNPNSIPFFTLLFLYSLHEMMEGKNRSDYRWPILVGIAMGVGVQLHTLLLLIMPMVSLVVLSYLASKKNLPVRNVFLVVAFALLINLPQIVSEIRTNGSNLQEFFMSSGVQSKGGTQILENIVTVVSCQIQANAEMVSSVENIKGCGDIFSPETAVRRYKNTPGVMKSVGLFELAMVFSVVFSVLGYFLAGYYYRKEDNTSKKNFLFLSTVYNAVSILFFMPVATHMELRYYVILFFTPFVLLGLWITFLTEKIPKIGRFICAAIIVPLLLLNSIVVWKASAPYRQHQASDAENSILGEIEPISRYIADNARSKTVDMIGERIYLKRFFPALVYLTNRSGIDLVSLKDTGAVTDQGVTLFNIAPTSSKKHQGADMLWGRMILDQRSFGKVTVSVLR